LSVIVVVNVVAQSRHTTPQSFLFFVFSLLKKEAKQISLSFGRLLRVKSILLDKTTDEAERIK